MSIMHSLTLNTQSVYKMDAKGTGILLFTFNPSEILEDSLDLLMSVL